MGGILQLCDFFHSQTFSNSRTARTERRTKVYDGSKRVFWRKDMPFGGPVDVLSPEGVETPQNRQVLAIKGEFPA